MSIHANARHPSTLRKASWLALGTGLVVCSAWAASESNTNTFLGLNAGNVNTIDSNNTFIGNDAGKVNGDGVSNTLIGAAAGKALITGSHNTFVGVSAGLVNTASDNTFVGRDAGRANTSAGGNTFVGRLAGLATTTGAANTYIGLQAGRENIEGSSNTFLGADAGFSNKSSENTFVGRSAGASNIFGIKNTYLGFEAGTASTSNRNTHVGYRAGKGATGSENSYFGHEAGLANGSGGSNSFFGSSAGNSNASGDSNSFFGAIAGLDTTSGSFNAFFGFGAGDANSIGNLNVAIGAYADVSSVTQNGTAIGAGAYAPNDNTIVLGSVPGINDPFGLFNSYVNVGIGTVQPGRQLDIRGVGAGQLNENTTALRISNASTTNTVRSLIQLQNNGNVRIDFKNATSATGWSFGTRGTGDDFAMTVTGRGSPVLNLSNNGTLTVTGAVIQNSDRNAKTGIVPVNADTLLAKVQALPISRWSYKDDGATAHLGPMAQDFHAAFGLGTDPTKIAPGDMAGVALAAIQAQQAAHQGQQTALQAQRKEIEQLKQSLAIRDAQIAAMGSRLDSLERSVESQHTLSLR